jgi:hypothetical protein
MTTTAERPRCPGRDGTCGRRPNHPGSCRTRTEMDPDTRAYLAELRREKRGTGARQVAAIQTAQAQAQADLWNAMHPVGTEVDRTDDLGNVHRTRTRSIAWVICGHASVLVEGITGGYLLSRMAPVASGEGARP